MLVSTNGAGVPTMITGLGELAEWPGAGAVVDLVGPSAAAGWVVGAPLGRAVGEAVGLAVGDGAGLLSAARSADLT